MCVAQLETPSGLKPGLQFGGNSFHSSPLERRGGFSFGRPAYPLRQDRRKRAKDTRDRKSQWGKGQIIVIVLGFFG
jgi:hypothetical protein